MLDPTEQHVEVEFRDGARWVPRYIALQLPEQGEEVFTMTYAEAMDYLNRKQVSDYINQAQGKIIDSHFARLRR